MDPVVFKELSNLKVKLEAIKNKTTEVGESHDFLVEAIGKIEIMLAYNSIGVEEKTSWLDKFKS